MISFNSNIQKFIEKNEINTDYFMRNKKANFFSKYDINPIVARYGIYKNETKLKISVENIIGKSREDTDNILCELNLLFDENAGMYQKRSISMLEYSKDNIVENLQDSFYNEPIRLMEIKKEKYIIKDDGMHRSCLLKAHFLNEVEKSSNNEIEIYKMREKYTIPVLAEKIDTIKTYSAYLIHLFDKNIKVENELDKNYKKTEKVLLYNEKDESKLLDDTQLIEYVIKNIKKIPKKEFKQIKCELYQNDEYFKEFFDNYLKI